MRTCTPHRVVQTAGLLLILATLGMAQEADFSASVDKNPVAVGDQFTLSFTLANAGMGGGKNLKLPDLLHFHILAGPNQSSSMQFVNGAVSSSVTYTYILQPKEIGKFTIAPATIEAGGKTLATKSIALEVVRSAVPQKRQSAPPEDQTEQIGDNLFLRASISREHVVQGEQVDLVFKLYTRVTVVSMGIKKAPTYAGCWAEEIDLPKSIQVSNETVGGKQYRVGVIKRVALFPTQSGSLEISPMEVQTTVQIQNTRSRDPFDAFFRDPFGRNVSYPLKSEAIRLKVDPLPPGAPADFRGAVGQFAMSTSLDKKTTRTNEPIGLKVVISGVGNIKLLEAPVVEFPPDFEQYSPKVSENLNQQGEKIAGSKTFEYLLLPRYPGLKIIKPVTFAFYDLSKREYVRLRSPQFEVNVEQGAATPQPLVAGSSREDVRLLSQDIRFIKTAPSAFHRPGDLLLGSPLFFGLVLLPLAGLAGTYAYTRQRQQAMADQVGYRNRRALRVARKGLRQAEYLLKEKGGSQGTPSSAQRARFYAEMSRALWKYLGDKLNIPQADFSVGKAVEQLEDRSVDAGLVQALKTLLEGCDQARFAPTNLELSSMTKSYGEAERIIVELERTLR
jgi:hypothetical protein